MDDNSAGSTAEEFQILSASTEKELDRRFLFAKHETNPDGINGDREDEHKLEKKHRIVLQEGLDDGVVIKEIPDDWTCPRVNVEAGEPQFEDVDNPGNWDRYCFRPKFTGSKETRKYTHHALPAGAQPVPANTDDGKRIVNGWEFHYKSCESIGNGDARHSATTENLFPQSRKGALDSEALEKLGLTKERMHNRDALFWYQLLLPIHDTVRTGIEEDPRSSFYSDVEGYTRPNTMLHLLA